MKINYLLPSLFLVITSVAYAQNDRSKSVKSKYLAIPAYDLTASNPSTVTAEFAMNDASFGTEKQKQVEAICKPKGGSIKDAVKLPTHYYEIPFTQPESYLVAKDQAGTIVYASKISEISQGIVKFGYEKCEYWMEATLKKDWAAQASSFKSKEINKHVDEVYAMAAKEAASNIYLSYVNQEFDVYSAKGKDFDYSNLDDAFEKAMATYENILNVGPNDADFKSLKDCIVVWEKELETADLEDKKARISESIAKGLHENCARAYMYMYDFDNAISHARSFQKLFGNMHTNRTNDFDVLVARMETQKIAATKNSGLMGDISGLNDMAKASATKTSSVTKLGSGDYDRLKTDFYLFKKDQFSDVNAARKDEEAAAIASGELNPYEKYISPGLTGPAIMMTMAPSALSGFPELKEFPKEMCELTQLETVLIMNNKIESVPAEIGKLTALAKLDLTGNNLKTLPPEIGQLTNLKTLKLNKNPIESLPKEIGNLENLKTLTLSGNTMDASAQAELERLLPNCKIKF